MNSMINLAKSMLVESAQLVIVESEKANFRPFGDAENQGYGGAETNAAIPVPLYHDHDDYSRIIVSGDMENPNNVNLEVHTMHPDTDKFGGSAITAHKDTWMHKAALAKSALSLHGGDHDAVHNALKAHGFEKVYM